MLYSVDVDIKEEIIEEPEIGFETLQDPLYYDNYNWFETEEPIEPKKKKKRKVSKVNHEGTSLIYWLAQKSQKPKYF